MEGTENTGFERFETKFHFMTRDLHDLKQIYFGWISSSC